MQGAPVYIGQTLVEMPANVIAQQSNHGSIHVLAAVASEGMGLRRTFPGPPCPLGTGGNQTFARGEFSIVSAAVPEPPIIVLIACGLLLIGILKFRYSFLTAVL